MSESPIERTKRKIVHAMHTYQPTYQTSFFFEYEDASDVLTAFSDIRKPLSEKFSDSVCIWWLRSINKYGTLQPMFQIFSTQKLNEEAIENITARLDDFPEYNLLQGTFSPQHLESWCNTVKKQRLHDIQRLYGKDRIKRWAVTNKKAAKQLDDD